MSSYVLNGIEIDDERIRPMVNAVKRTLNDAIVLYDGKQEGIFVDTFIQIPRPFNLAYFSEQIVELLEGLPETDPLREGADIARLKYGVHLLKEKKVPIYVLG